MQLSRSMVESVDVVMAGLELFLKAFCRAAAKLSCRQGRCDRSTSSIRCHVRPDTSVESSGPEMTTSSMMVATASLICLTVAASLTRHGA